MKPEEIASRFVAAWDVPLHTSLADAMRTYGESEYQRGLEAAASYVDKKYPHHDHISPGDCSICHDVNGIRALSPAAGPSSEYQRGRGDGLEEAAAWHEARAARVEMATISSAFLTDAERDYIAKRAVADRDDAKSIRALAEPPK